MKSLRLITVLGVFLAAGCGANGQGPAGATGGAGGQAPDGATGGAGNSGSGDPVCAAKDLGCSGERYGGGACHVEGETCAGFTCHDPAHGFFWTSLCCDGQWMFVVAYSSSDATMSEDGGPPDAGTCAERAATSDASASDVADAAAP